MGEARAAPGESLGLSVPAARTGSVGHLKLASYNAGAKLHSAEAIDAWYAYCRSKDAGFNVGWISELDAKQYQGGTLVRACCATVIGQARAAMPRRGLLLRALGSSSHGGAGGGGAEPCW